METSEVLYGAADKIQQDGWWSRVHGTVATASAAEPWCASNAIRSVGTRPLSLAHKALISYLGGDGVGTIFAWNDAPGRTAAEVIEVLRAAAVIEAAKEQAAVDTPAVSVAPVRSAL